MEDRHAINVCPKHKLCDYCGKPASDKLHTCRASHDYVDHDCHHFRPPSGEDKRVEEARKFCVEKKVNPDIQYCNGFSLAELLAAYRQPLEKRISELEEALRQIAALRLTFTDWKPAEYAYPLMQNLDKATEMAKRALKGEQAKHPELTPIWKRDSQ